MGQNLILLEMVKLERVLEWNDNALTEAKLVQNMSVDQFA